MDDTNPLLQHDPVAGVRVLTLNRPERLNALNGTLTANLLAAIAACSQDHAIKVVIIRAAGRAFCAGADLKWLASGVLADHHAHLQFQDDLAGLCNAIEAAPQVVIGSVQGFALAGGLELLLACDMIVAAEGAEMGDEHIKRNLIPGGGGSQRLPRKIGLARGLYHLLTGKRITGLEAVQMGLACAAVLAEDLEQTTLDLATSLAKTDGKALSTTKELVRRGMELPLTEALWLERWMQYRYRNASEAMDKGVADFAQKRTQ